MVFSAVLREKGRHAFGDGPFPRRMTRHLWVPVIAFLAGVALGSSTSSNARAEQPDLAPFEEAWGIYLGCVREFEDLWDSRLAERARRSQDPVLNEVLQSILKPLAAGAHAKQVLERSSIIDARVVACPNNLVLR